MNQCILMAEIIQDPQLRYTSDNQTPLAEMMVQFPGSREEDPPGKLKVVGWGNLAQEIQSSFRQGDRVILEGRLGMNTVERPEGFKEKRAELTIQRIHRIGADASLTTSAAQPAPSAPAAPAASAPAAAAAKTPATKAKPAAASASKAPAYSASTSEAADFDEIPF